MSKLTAVEWLFEQIYGDKNHIGSYTTDGKDAFTAFEQAKAMEREQIKESYKAGYSHRDAMEWEGKIDWNDESHHQDNKESFTYYFHETYKGGKQ